MADKFSGIERLLGLPQGSTAKINPEEAPKVLTKAVKNKTTQLEKDLKQVDTLTETMSSADLVKCGMSIESLEADKVVIRQEAFEVFRIGKTLLNKYMEDVEEQVDTNDRMYTAGSHLLTSATNSLEKLSNMILRFKQEEEIKGLSMVDGDENGKTKEMSPEDWIDFVDGVKEDENQPPTTAVDAEVVETVEEKEEESDR